jgi:hypothetical protein
MMSQKGSVMKSIILGPEILWLAVYAATTFIAGRNSAPTFPLNNFLSSAYWLAPSAVAILVFVLCFQFRFPAPPSWGLLARIALASAVGVCFMTNAIVEKIDVPGSAKSGLGTGFMVAVMLHLMVIGAATLYGIVVLFKTGGIQPFWSFLKYAGIAVAVVAALLYAVSFAFDRQTEGLSGEDKARRLSQAHGQKIGAKFPGEWRDGRKNWTNLEIQYVAPNSVRLTTTVKYGEHRRPSDPERHLAEWNGDVGASFLEFIGAKRKWQASWPEDGDTTSLIWSVDIDMKGLSKNQFLNDTAEAARLYIGPMSGWAGNDTWWLFGDAIEEAIQSGSTRHEFALTWLGKALGHAAMYYERAKTHPERLEQIKSVQSKVHTLPAIQLFKQVRVIEDWKHLKHADTDYAFLLNGSQRYIGLARQYAEKHQ